MSSLKISSDTLGGSITLAAPATASNVTVTLPSTSGTTALQDDLTAGLALKADTSTVNAALALKADTSTVNAALALKADTSTVNAALALKANTTALPTAMDSATAQAGTSTTAQTVSASVLKSAYGTVNINVVLSTSNTAAQNTILIQNALDAASLTKGGIVSVGPSGQFNISGGGTYEILNIDSNITLSLANGLELIGPSDATIGKPIIANKNWKSNKTTATSAITSVVTTQSGHQWLTCTVPETGHTKTVGQFVLIKGDTTEIYNGVWKVDSVSTNSWTFRIDGYHTAPASSSGTITLYLANSNITITGDGKLNQNVNGYYIGSGSGYYNGSHCSIFNKISNLYLNPSCFTNAAKYAMYICNASNVRILDGVVSNPSDGIHIHGPCQKVFIGKILASTGDDNIAFTTCNTGYSSLDLTDADGTKNSDGTIDTVIVDNLVSQVGGSRNLLLSGGGANTYQIKNFEAKGLNRQNSFSGTGGCVVFENLDATGTALFKNIKINNLTGNFAGLNPITLGSFGAVNIDGLTIDGITCKQNGSYLGLKNSVIAAPYGGSVFNDIKIRNIDIDFDQTGYQTNVTAGLIPNGGGIFDMMSYQNNGVAMTLKNIAFSNCDIVANGTMSSSYRIMNTGGNIDLDNITFLNCYNDCTNSGIYYNYCSTNTNFVNIKASNCGVGANAQAVFVFSSSQNMFMYLSNIDAEDCSQGMLFFYGGNGVSHRINATSCRVNQYLITMNGGTNVINLSEAGCTSRNGITVSTNVSAGTVNLIGSNADLAIDVGLTARFTAVKGVLTYHTSSVAGRNAANQQGLAIYNGTNWYALGTGAGGINTLIV